jgi:hypothetical protein
MLLLLRTSKLLLRILTVLSAIYIRIHYTIKITSFQFF